MSKTFKMPAAFLAASATVSEKQAKIQANAPAAVTARIDMSAEVAGAGLCPECRRPMENSHANGIPVLICSEHRIAIPIPNQTEDKTIPI
jgi:hypothetical protein